MSEAAPEPGAVASSELGGEPATAPDDAGTGGAPLRPAGAPGAGAARATGASSGWLTRIGLAVGRPRWALAIAADRRYAGRSGSDLIALIAILLVATQLRWLAAAVWLGGAVDAGLGLRAAMRVVTGALTVDLGALLVGALAVFALAGRRRNLGRAFDLACVAVLPVVLVQLGATVLASVLAAVASAAFPAVLSWPLALGWMGALITLAIGPARSAARPPVPPAPAVRPGRWIGAAIAAVAALGVAGQVIWIAGNLDLVRPMKSGGEAPAIALPRIGPGGALGDRVTLAASRGKITVLDFWATWCKPCLAAMPRLDRVARSHPDVAVIAVNLDDATAARALFDQRGYAMTLVADDGDTSQRYSVSTIPHTVIIDRRGVVREVAHGTADVAAMVEAIRAAE